jgi:microcin C transport system ATP-binding protein
MTTPTKLTEPLLRYENFSIAFGSGRRKKFAVNQLNLVVGVGERVALVGESGSGKTLTALAPLRLEQGQWTHSLERANARCTC